MEHFKTTDMSHADWLNARTMGCGGSDIAILMGLSKYKSPYELWQEKTKRAKVEDVESEACYWGTVLESVVRQEYTRRTGNMVERVNFMFLDGNRIANIDGAVPYDGHRAFVDHEFRGLKLFEAKTCSIYMADQWGEPGSDDIPQAYKLQVQHYMGVLGAKSCDVAVLIGGQKFQVYTVEFDPALDVVIREAIDIFWDHVKRDIAPEPRSLAEVMQQFPQSQENSIVADDEIEAAWQDLKETRYEIKELQLREDSIKDEVAIFMGNHESLRLTDGTRMISWKTAKDTSRTDWKRICELEGISCRVIDENTTTTPGSRRFLIK